MNPPGIRFWGAMKTKSNNTTPRLGIDIGRVIIHDGGPDTSFASAGTNLEAVEARAMDGALDTIARLVRCFSPENVWLVSKCGQKVERRSRLWLARHRFFETTGIPPKNLRFCRDRAHKA